MKWNWEIIICVLETENKNYVVYATTENVAVCMSAKAELKHFYSQEIMSSFEKKNSKHNFQNEKHKPKTKTVMYF